MGKFDDIKARAAQVKQEAQEGYAESKDRRSKERDVSGAPTNKQQFSAAVTEAKSRKLEWDKYHKTHKIYKCKSCGQTLRVPKGKGKVKVTCPVCKSSFIAKS